MQLDQLSTEKLSRKYGILCQPLDFNGGGRKPFHATHCVIEAGGATEAHEHFETETFFLLKGEGIMVIDGEKRTVRGGDLVFIPPFSNHQLINPSREAPLSFLSTYAEEHPLPALPEQAVIASAPPTPNGELHLGHLSGPYVAADVLHRYLKMNEVSSLQISGTDDHQPYVFSQAEKLGQGINRTVEQFRSPIQSALSSTCVELSHFLSPIGDREYQNFVQDFYAKLSRRGTLFSKRSPVPYCPACETLRLEDQIVGRCPSCSAPGSGNTCEECGYAAESHARGPAHCGICRSPLTLREIERQVLPLELYRTRLENYIAGATMPAKLKTLARGFIENLYDFSVTLPRPGGIPVPLAGYEGQSVQVWFEMAAGYVYQLEKSGQDRPAFIPAFGIDNSFYYTVVIPAVLMAAGEERYLPRYFVFNEFYHLEGEKFSTSRRHAVWALEMLEDVSADTLRLFLCSDRPESFNSSFSYAKMARFVSENLLPLQGLLDEVNRLLPRMKDMKKRLFSESDRHFVFALNDRFRRYRTAMHPQAFSPKKAVREITGLIRELEDFYHMHRKGEGFASTESFVTLLLGIQVLGLLLQPFAPNLAEKILASFELSSSSFNFDRALELRKHPERLPETLFRQDLRQLRLRLQGEAYESL